MKVLTNVNICCSSESLNRLKLSEWIRVFSVNSTKLRFMSHCHSSLLYPYRIVKELDLFRAKLAFEKDFAFVVIGRLNQVTVVEIRLFH